ncbi:hypothetical protein TRFO_34696 [Tritrichomonas foetus]|uniref:Leucine Rich Repeat family protein n=1 Tax=Tritrichomonas foetus TaxID=1144522 RepID=A0A1J4JNW9_9EUKA|nr:hypothetical protein TRFO_34696 [Tritrichomonas foetus]|eukprot:OHS98964.1 hypothetical protein TRFO_34696 [Tritrichomonas foetus]
MILPENFQFKLQLAERRLVEQSIPQSQRRVSLAFHANFTSLNSKKLYSNGIIVLTEHYIIPLVSGFFGALKQLQQVHICELESITVQSEKSILIEYSNKNSYQIYSTAVLRFAKSLIRNYFLGVPLFQRDRLEIQFIDSNHGCISKLFPPFSPKISPPQLFQLHYNSMCSYFKTGYFHQISHFYYNLLDLGNPIFNCNLLPVYYTEPKFGLNFSLQPITHTLAYSPYTHVFSADGLKSHNLLKYSAVIATTNPSCKALRVRNCGSNANDGKEFYEEFEKKDNDFPIYYDFSGNQVRDFSELMKIFFFVKSKIISLNFENCSLAENAFMTLFQAINQKENLWGIKQLLLAGNYMNEACIETCSDLFKEFKNSKLFPFTSISFGPCENIEKMLMMIDYCDQPISHLRIFKTPITLDAAYDICRFMNRSKLLNHLELENCPCDDDTFSQIIETLEKNENLKDLKISFDEMKLHGVKFSILINFIRNGFSKKVNSLSLNKNHLDINELSMLVDLKNHLPNLKSISLNANFNSVPGTGQLLTKFFDFPSLVSISVNGLGITTLKTEVIPLLDLARKNTKIKHIDVTKNLIGELGFNAILNLLKENHTLHTLKFSSTELHNVQNIFDVLKLVGSHTSLCNLVLYHDDVIRILRNQSPAILDQYSTLLEEAVKTITHNLAKIGLVSDLSFGNDQLLNEILVDATLQLDEKLQGFPPTSFSAFNKMYSLPFPSESSNSMPSKWESDDDDVKDDSYLPNNLTGEYTVKGEYSSPTVILTGMLRNRPDLKYQPKPQLKTKILSESQMKTQEEAHEEQEEQTHEEQEESHKEQAHEEQEGPHEEQALDKPQ